MFKIGCSSEIERLLKVKSKSATLTAQECDSVTVEWPTEAAEQWLEHPNAFKSKNSDCILKIIIIINHEGITGWFIFTFNIYSLDTYNSCTITCIISNKFKIKVRIRYNTKRITFTDTVKVIGVVPNSQRWKHLCQ